MCSFKEERGKRKREKKAGNLGEDIDIGNWLEEREGEEGGGGSCLNFLHKLTA